MRKERTLPVEMVAYKQASDEDVYTGTEMV